jgi:hypothetical protein
VTPTVSPRRRGALALGGIFVVAGTMLATPQIAFAAPSTEAVNAINDRYSTFGGEGSLLGPAIGEAEDVQGGVKREFQGGTIYYSKDSGAHVMYGQILERYKALGGPTSGLGFPKNDESDTGDGVGRFNDFSTPEGASIYWSPQQGASVVKGKVLEAWRQSGGITGPFGYPSADVSDMGGVLTGKFVGPEGTEIQWSKAAGLVTIPAALAGKIPGFGKEGTASVSKPNVTAPTAPKVEKEGGFKWWWLIPILGLLGLLAFLPRLFKKKPVEVAPVKVAPRAPEVKKVVTPPPPPRPAPVAKPVTPPAPPRPAPKPPAPAPKPVVKTPPPPPPAPKPVVRPVEHIREEVKEVKANIREEVKEVKAHIREEVTEAKATIREAVHHDDDVAPVIKYETHTPAETSIRVTYENNAVGDHQESRADKSDLTPDHLQD